MLRDIRDTPHFRAMQDYYARIYGPGLGSVTYAAEVAIAPGGHVAAFTGTILLRLDGAPRRAVFVVDLETGARRRVTHGPGDAFGAKWSPCGRRLAFLSDRAEAGIFQGYLLEAEGLSDAMPMPGVDGVVEYLDWSPDGRRVLLGVAGEGAELSGMQGSTTTRARASALPSWMPSVQAGFGAQEWRRAWVFDASTGRCEPISAHGRNLWEAAWSGNDRILAVVSPRPDEAAWYTASLVLIDPATGAEQEVHRPRDQLGSPAATPDGRHVAVIEAVCSDRAVVAGDLRVGSPVAGLRRVDACGVDLTHIVWRDNRRLVGIGVRGQETTVVEHDVEQGATRELWTSAEYHGGFWYPAVAPYRDEACVLVSEGYLHPPELAIVAGGGRRVVARFTHADTDSQLAAGLYGDRAEALAWAAPDGLEIQGTLLLPEGRGPFPTIMEVHGGPIWMQRSRWMAGIRAEPQAFVHRGYAVFRPNPRGSGGRGQAYARRVVGDMGGLDTQDLLAGLDELVARGVADADRIGVMGVSYGGYMSSWIVTQDRRFKASIPISPVTDWVSMQWTSNVPHFVRTFLDDAPLKADGLFHARSPVKFVDRVSTPTLLVAGVLDRISPPDQAVEFYRALREYGVESALVLYPEEGHNVRNLPATIDASARYLRWFDRFLRGR